MTAAVYISDEFARLQKLGRQRAAALDLYRAGYTPEWVGDVLNGPALQVRDWADDHPHPRTQDVFPRHGHGRCVR